MPNTDAIATVLVVEDDTLVRMHGTDILENAGYEVLEAANADEALAILNEQRDVDVLFSDVDMPGSMDGLDLARLVHERWPNIHLLLTSGHHPVLSADLPERGKFVRKPWSSEVLVDRIRGLLYA
jgi:CheY-like chemotaxis protein